MAEAAEKQTVETPERGGDLVVFSDLDRQLAELRDFDASRSFDYRNAKDNEAARSHVYKLRRTKTAIDTARKNATKPLRERIDAINAEGKRLIGEVEGLIQPHQAAIEQVEREEAERQERLQAAVSALRDWCDAEPEAGSDRLYAMACEAEALAVTTDEWGDYAAAAEAAREKAAKMLRMRADQAAKAEAAETERERERQAREQEQAEREREREELEQLRREKAERERQERQAAEAARSGTSGDENGAEGVTGDTDDAGDTAGAVADAGKAAEQGLYVGEADARRGGAIASAFDAFNKAGIETDVAVVVVNLIARDQIDCVRLVVEG